MAQIELRMRDQLDPILIDGTFEGMANEINLQMVQGKQLLAFKTSDGRPIAINVNNINSIKAPSMEDAFFKS